MEHKNSFHIKKLNHQSGYGWAEMMRAGYVWLAALLCFIWYAAGRFEMYTAGVVLFIGAAFFILLYFIGISVGKGFAVFISVLYFFCSVSHSFYGKYSKSIVDFLPNSL